MGKNGPKIDQTIYYGVELDLSCSKFDLGALVLCLRQSGRDDTGALLLLLALLLLILLLLATAAPARPPASKQLQLLASSCFSSNYY